MKIAGLLLCVAIAGCGQPAEWTEAASKHACTDDQMKKAQQEALWCKENTTYLPTYCYSTAIMRNCTKKAGVKP